MNVRLAFAAFLVAALSACGSGGKSGGGTTTPTTTPTTDPVPTVNAGPDQSVPAGTLVKLGTDVKVANASAGTSITGGSGIEIVVGTGNFTVEGSSTTPSDIVKLTWTRTEGPVTPISRKDITTGNFTFVAPTPTEATLTITYQLTLTNAAGKSASDTVKVTVTANPTKPAENKAPVADAGIDQAKFAGDTVNLSAANSKDTDGTLVSYQWEQIAGSTLTAVNTTAATLSFTAPDVKSLETFEWRVTVKDDKGASSIDTVSVTVAPLSPVKLSVNYPPNNSDAFRTPTINLYGAASTREATIEKVEVIGAGGVAVTASIKDGSWRAEKVPLDAKASSNSIQVIATDSLGRTDSQTINLSNKASRGTLGPWKTVTSMGLDSAKNQLIVMGLSSDTLVSQKVVAIDLSTGIAGPNLYTITENNLIDFSRGYFDATTKILYATTLKNSGLSLPVQIVAIDTQLKRLSVISDLNRGTGVALERPIGLVGDGKDSLYVADNGGNRVIKVDIKTGNRTEVINKQTKPVSAEFAVNLAYDPLTPDTLYFLPYYEVGRPTKVMLNENPISSVFIPGTAAISDSTTFKYAIDIAVDAKKNKLFLRENETAVLYSLDMTSGEKKKIMGSAGKMFYDQQRGILYVSDSNGSAIYAVDPDSTSDYVIVSGSPLLMPSSLLTLSSDQPERLPTAGKLQPKL